VNRNDENEDESMSVLSSSSGITSCRASKLHGVATWCAALQHGAPWCNSLALRSAELQRLGGCKLRHVAFQMQRHCAVLQHPVLHHDTVAQHVKAAW